MNRKLDTIAALASAPGQGGISIVRISGSLSRQIAGKISRCSEFKPRTASFTAFIDDYQNILDEGILLYFPAPHSFTGEDVVECQIHGSPVITDLLLKAICAAGARLARPGEFSERAFLNDKIDLAQAEAIADLIEAGTEKAARLAGESLRGVFSKAIHELVEKLIYLRMYVEASIDFPEEEIDFLKDEVIHQTIKDIEQSFDDIQQKAAQGSLIREGMTLVIAGQPNAGKSSLLNALSGDDNAIVTDIPGTTRDILKEKIQIDGIPIHLIDTAGIRESTDRVEQEGIRRARQQIDRADHILWIYDAVKDPDHKSFASAYLPTNVPVTFIKNKIDLLEHHQQQAQSNELSISAKKGIGIDELKQHLKQCMGYRDDQQGAFLARRRHLEALNRARQHLDNGKYNLEDLQAGELLAEELRLAQNELGEITGEFTSDDLLGRIFSSFCIGK